MSRSSDDHWFDNLPEEAEEENGPSSDVVPVEPPPTRTLNRIQSTAVIGSRINMGTLPGSHERPRVHREKSVVLISNPLQAQSNYSKIRTRFKQLFTFQSLSQSSSSSSLFNEANGTSIRNNSTNISRHHHPPHPCTSCTNTRKRFRIRSVKNRDEAWLELPDQALIQSLTNYFTWTFRSTFVAVILSACILYFVWIFVFAIVIYGVMKKFPNCVTSSAEDSYYYWTDAYHLSWTTLGTVGYGLIGPAVGVRSQRWCLLFNAFMAFESFFGIIFSSLIGAIIFSKVARVQSVATVRFSHVICVRYGTGVQDNDSHDSDTNGSAGKEEEEEETELLPCPVLEFRLINSLNHWTGGEIIDANVRVVACVIDEDEEHDSRLEQKKRARQNLRTALVAQRAAATLMGAGCRLAGNAADMTRQGARKLVGFTTGNLIQQVNWAILQQNHAANTMVLAPVLEHDPTDPAELQQQQSELHRRGSVSLDNNIETRTVVAVNEGNSKLLPPRKYHKLHIETDKHPFFIRSWMIRHVLDESSPLLSAEARRLIVENNGSWPYATHQDVRSHLKFTQMIVNFAGTANASGSSVYAQTVYDFSSLYIGYSFANLLTMQKGRVVVDEALLDDIREQKGGGAEPLEEMGHTNGFTMRNVPTDEILTKEEDDDSSNDFSPSSNENKQPREMGAIIAEDEE